MNYDEKCTCDEQKFPEEHSCPFKEDINNDPDTKCTCCPECTYQCAMDI